jgi:protein SCO1/2
MTRGVRFFLVLGLGLLVLNGALFVARGMLRPMYHTSVVTTSGTALIGGPFTLSTTDGRVVTDQTYRGKWLLIYFGYTSCPDACPTALTNMSIALQQMRSEAKPIQPLFITVDPEHDTAAVLRDYLSSFDPRIVGLTGSSEQTDAIVKTYRVYVKRDSVANARIDHSSYFYLMDLTGKFVDVKEGATPSDQLADWLRKSIREHSACRFNGTCPA